MATLIFTAVGSAIGGPIGGFVGGVIGSFLDSAYVYPALFGTQTFEGPRLNDLRAQTASEGQSINLCIGPRNRVAGNVIWLPDLIEARHEEEAGKGGGGNKVVTYAYYANVAIGICEGEISSIKKIWADSKVIYDNGVVDSRYSALRIYLGTGSQVADSLIEAHEGAGNVPAFRHLAYVVIDRLALADFGNRLPNFTFLVEADVGTSGISVRTAISEILDRSGLVSSQYDVSKTTGCLQGYTIKGPTDGVKSLEPLLTAFDIVVTEYDGKIRFQDRDLADTIQLDPNLLGTTDSVTNQDVQAFPVQDVSSFDLPSEVNVDYLDPALDYQRGSQREKRISVLTNRVERIDLPLVMESSDARKLAKLRLWRSWAERGSVKISLPPRYLNVRNGDLLSLTYQGEAYALMVTRIDRGANFVIDVEAVIVDTQILSQSSTVEVPIRLPASSSPLLPGTYNVVTFDTGALLDAHTTEIGYYLFVVNTDPSVPFIGGVLMSATTENGGYSQTTTIGISAKGGRSSSLLATGPIGYWDRVNTVDVIVDGTLSSVTEDDVLNGINTAVLGGEIIGYVTATLLASGQYRLSQLLRGLRGTEGATVTHTSTGEDFVVLDRATANFIPISNAEVGLTRYFKAVPTNVDITTVTAEAVTFSGGTIRPMRVAHITGTRNGSNDLTVNWVRRTRAIIRMFAQVNPVPLLETTELYEVDFLDSGTVVRTKTVTATTTVAYTAAEQTTDGLTPGNPVDLVIYQISNKVGRGTAATETV